MRRKNLLVTGPPGCGKSTVVETVVRRLHGPMTGFFTREIKEKGSRRGFKIVTLDGKEGILARDDFGGSIRVGRYGVNLDDLERIAVPSIIASELDQIVVIDEIGKMECYSSLFRDTLVQTLDSPTLVIGSIGLKGGSFIQGIKNRLDVAIYFVSENNRDDLPGTLVRPGVRSCFLIHLIVKITRDETATQSFFGRAFSSEDPAKWPA